MKKHTAIILVASAVALAAVAVVFIGQRAFASQAASIATDDFLRERALVYAKLHERFAAPVEGVSLVLPPSRSSLARTFRPFPDDDHIRQVVRRQEWSGISQGHRLFHIAEHGQ